MLYQVGVRIPKHPVLIMFIHADNVDEAMATARRHHPTAEVVSCCPDTWL